MTPAASEFWVFGFWFWGRRGLHERIWKESGGHQVFWEKKRVPDLEKYIYITGSGLGGLMLMSDWLAGGWWSDTPTILSQSPFFCLCSEEEDVFVKERVAHCEREGRASWVLERFYYVFFFFLILCWRIQLWELQKLQFYMYI